MPLSLTCPSPPFTRFSFTASLAALFSVCFRVILWLHKHPPLSFVLRRPSAVACTHHSSFILQKSRATAPAFRNLDNQMLARRVEEPAASRRTDRGFAAERR